METPTYHTKTDNYLLEEVITAISRPYQNIIVRVYLFTEQGGGHHTVTISTTMLIAIWVWMRFVGVQLYIA